MGVVGGGAVSPACKLSQWSFGYSQSLTPHFHTPAWFSTIATGLEWLLSIGSATDRTLKSGFLVVLNLIVLNMFQMGFGWQLCLMSVNLPVWSCDWTTTDLRPAWDRGRQLTRQHFIFHLVTGTLTHKSGTSSECELTEFSTVHFYGIEMQIKSSDKNLVTPPPRRLDSKTYYKNKNISLNINYMLT